MKWKGILIKSVLLLCIAQGVNVFATNDVSAENYIPDSGNFRLNSPYYNPIIEGSNYWGTSLIREWLHSTEKEPIYTNVISGGGIAHTDSPGFLNEFTEEEINSILPTRRRVRLRGQIHEDMIEDGRRSPVGPSNDASGGVPFIHLSAHNPKERRMSEYNRPMNDKVFILDTAEYQQYVQQRGLDNRKQLLGEERYRDYWMDTPFNNILLRFVRSDGIITLAGNLHHEEHKRGVVPALHLDKESSFAEGLTLGSNLIFGKYNGTPIIWEVINIVEDGHFLLWADNIIEELPYSVDMSVIDEHHMAYSEQVYFDSYDIDLYDDLQYYNEYNHDVEPSFTLLNEEDYMERQSEPYQLEIEANSEVGIEYIETPDGIRHYSDNVRWTVSENVYRGNIMKTKDIYDNFHYTMYPIGNIDTETEVSIDFLEFNTGWHNENVHVDIGLSSFEFNEHIPFIGTNTRGQHIFFYNKNNHPGLRYTSFVGKQFRVSGRGRFSDPGDALNANNQDVMSRFRFQYVTIQESSSNPGEYVPVDRNVFEDFETHGELANGEWIDFDFTIATNEPQLPSRFRIFWDLRRNYTSFGETFPIREMEDVEIELLDDDDLTIDEVRLPNGDVIYDPTDTVTDILTESGEYTYEILDGRGLTTTETIDVRIDKENPTIRTEIE